MTNNHWKNCSTVAHTWRCLDDDRAQFEAFFRMQSAAQLAVYFVIYVMCLINTIICHRQFNQGEFRGRSIPVMLKMKSTCNLACMTCWMPVRVFFQTGVTAVTVPKAFICPLFLFFVHLFSFMANWTEVISALYRFIRSIVPVSTIRHFLSEKPAYFAVCIVVLISICVNINDLILPAVDGCQYRGGLYCTPRILPANTGVFFIVGFWIPVIVCLTLLILMTMFKRKRIRESQRYIDPIFQRSYSFGFASTMIFIVTSVPWIMFCSYMDLIWGKEPCNHVKRGVILFELTYAVRHLGLSIDWLAFLAISPLFRYETAYYLKAQLRRSQVVSV